MKNNKGFTLIELLAVILILGIIALIAIPTVSSVVNQARKGSIEATGNQIVKSAEQFFTICELNGGYDKNGNKCFSDIKESLYSKEELADIIGVKGDIPDLNDLIVFKKNDDGTAALIYKSGSYICSNQIDSNEKVSFTYTGINNNGVKCTEDNINLNTKHYLKAFSNAESFQNEELWYERTEFHDSIYESKIHSVSFVKNDEVPSDAVVSWDLSEEQDNSIKGWLVNTPDIENRYDLYIGSKGDIYANPDSYSLFENLVYCESYDFSNFHVDDMVMANNLFSSNYYLNSLDLSSWNVSKVRNLSNMFMMTGYFPTSFDIIGLNNWNTSNVNDMSYMFYLAGYTATAFNIGDLSNWNTSKVTNMNNMFAYAGYKSTSFDIGNLDNWDIKNVTNLGCMFNNTGHDSSSMNIGKLDNWNTSNVTTLNAMFRNGFYKVNKFDIGDIGNWNVSKVTTMQDMFYNAGYSAKTWNIGKLDNWNTESLTNLVYTFFAAGNSATTFDIGNLDNWNTSKVTNMYSTFWNAGLTATTFNIGNLANWDVQKVGNMGGMFRYAGKNASYSMDLSGWKVNLKSQDSFNSGVESKIIPPVWK